MIDQEPKDTGDIVRLLSYRLQLEQIRIDLERLKEECGGEGSSADTSPFLFAGILFRSHTHAWQDYTQKTGEEYILDITGKNGLNALLTDCLFH